MERVGEGVCEEVVGIFVEGHLKVELCVIFFGLPKNKNYEYQSLLYSLPTVLARLEHWLEVLAEFHLNMGEWDLCAELLHLLHCELDLRMQRHPSD